MLKIRTGMAKKYEQIEPKTMVAKEPMVAYSSKKTDSCVTIGERDNIKQAISGEELLNRLRPRIKALFE